MVCGWFEIALRLPTVPWVHQPPSTIRGADPARQQRLRIEVVQFMWPVPVKGPLAGGRIHDDYARGGASCAAAHHR